MKLVLLLVAASITALAAATASPAVAREKNCGTRPGAAAGTYAYAGHEGSVVASGVRATIAPLAAPHVATGHVAAWVGVGGVRSGPKEMDEWLQVGIGSLPDNSLFVYSELTRSGGQPTIRTLRADVAVGEAHRLAVASVTGRPNWWRVWLDGAAVSAPVHLAGSSRRWNPIATAESFSIGGQNPCNTFSFRFDRVEVAGGENGAWRPFVSHHRFLDRGYAVQPVRAIPFGFVAKSLQ